MPEWAKDVLTQAPLAGLMLFALWMFLGFLKGERVDRKATLQEIGEACHNHQKDLVQACTKVIERNANSTEASTRVMTRVEKVLDRMNGGPK